MTVKVQLFITCLAEQFFPSVLENMVAILERVGVEVEFPAEQTCCGQPFYNSGFQKETARMAEHWLDIFSRSSAMIVSPSGSCVDMVCRHYPHLFPEDSSLAKMAGEVASRTFEFSQFLVNQLKVVDVGASYPHRVTYHASCHLLRGLKVQDEPLKLLEAVRGLELVKMTEQETCCGFGGVFSVLFPEVSRAMMESKIDHIRASGADTVTACDPGCLMNIGGGLHKTDPKIKALHLIDILAAQEEIS
jgi:L-lactate dehydrogenase complex protein LldE